jgi:hypothetical protein
VGSLSQYRGVTATLQGHYGQITAGHRHITGCSLSHDKEITATFYDVACNISQALDCGPLAVLHVTGDEIGEAAAAHIGRALPRCLHLASLCLSRNPLGDPGVIALAGGLSACGALTSLTLVGRCKLKGLDTHMKVLCFCS